MLRPTLEDLVKIMDGGGFIAWHIHGDDVVHTTITGVCLNVRTWHCSTTTYVGPVGFQRDLKGPVDSYCYDGDGTLFVFSRLWRTKLEALQMLYQGLRDKARSFDDQRRDLSQAAEEILNKIRELEEAEVTA